MTQINNVTIIIPYFGKLPDLAGLFFMSAGYNPQIKFLFFTDQKRPEGLPDNVCYINISLKKFNALATQKLGLKIKIIYPYKLCDLKPMYGIIFEDYLSESQFWGYCDVDMIFGDFSDFLSEDIKEGYDIITSRKDSLAGNFTLYKNTAKLKLLFQESDCWKEILNNTLWVHSFPERFKAEGRPVSKSISGKVFRFFRKPNFKTTLIPDINTILVKNPEIKVYYGNFMLSDMMLKNQKIKAWKINWEAGRLINSANKSPLLYFHFYFLKNNQEYFNPKNIYPPEIQRISITTAGIEVY
jgi:hypothetical protein